MLAVILGALAATACSSSDRASSESPKGDAPPGETVGQTTEGLSAYLTSEGSRPIRVDDLAIGANAETTDALTRSGCGAFVKSGEGSLHFRARGIYPTAFVEWASREMAKSPVDAVPRIGIAVANEKGEVKCRVAVEPASMEKLTLNGGGARIDDPKLEWELKGGVSVAAGDVTGDGRGGAIDEGIGDVQSNDGEPVAIGLLVPAVQKVRGAAMRGNDYPLYQKDVALPPPFEVDIDEDAFADLFDGAMDGELELGVLTIAPKATGYYVGSANGGVWKTTNVSFTFKLTKQQLAASHTKMKAVPAAAFRIALPITDSRLAAAKTRADALATQIGETLDLDAVSRLLSALEGQPSGSGAPSTRRDQLSWYWRGDPAKGSAGEEKAFATGLGEFLGKASDVEGLWAYKRLPTAAKLFSRLDAAEGRAFSEAATQIAPDATFPLRPGRLRTTSALEGHDYRAARAAVAFMTVTDQALMGVEPDEIDVANAAKAEASPAVSSVDAGARNFLLARDALLDAPTVDDAALLDLSAKSAALVKDLDALRTVTKTRFIASK